MSKGKYSPTLFYRKWDTGGFDYNARGEIPPAEWDVFDDEIHFANYDSDGFDSYGYSAYDYDGKFVGIGSGVDRAGYTENEYLCMTDEEFDRSVDQIAQTEYSRRIPKETAMARETKAQRQAREEAERFARVSLAKATYTKRYMAVLARARKMNFELEVNDALVFLVSDRDRRNDYFYVDPEWSEAADVDLYSLELAVESKEEEEAERNRKANLRKTALAKLTEEERAALDL